MTKDFSSKIMKDKRYKLPVIKWVSVGDLIYSMMTIVNNVLYTWKLLREQILNVITTKKNVMDMLTDLTVVIISQYTRISNNYNIHLKLARCCQLYLNKPIRNEKKKKWSRNSFLITGHLGSFVPATLSPQHHLPPHLPCPSISILLMRKSDRSSESGNAGLGQDNDEELSALGLWVLQECQLVRDWRLPGKSWSGVGLGGWLGGNNSERWV